MSADCLQTFLFENNDIRGAIVSLEHSLAEMFSGQTYEPPKKQLLSEFAAANILLSSHIKFEGRLSLQARGGKGIELIMTESTDSLDYRGVIQGKDSIDEKSFTEILAGGTLTITITPQKGQQYQGIVPLQAGSLAGCLGEYFYQSEQLPSWFYFSQTENNGQYKVVGIMLQAMPAQICIDNEQREEDWNRLTHLASTLKPQETATLSHEEILYRLYHEESVRLFEPKPAQYHCNCSRERMERGLLSLGTDELSNIVAEQGDTTTQCHFCNTEYHFSQADILQLIQGSGAKKSH